VSRAALLPAAVLAMALAGGCGPSEPVPLAYGEDTCDRCHMGLVDERYGAELITRTGRVYTFDSVECLAAFYLREIDRGQVASLWVTNFRAPSRLVPAEEAFYLRSPDLRSPMGMNLTAFGPGIERRAVENSFGGEILDWAGVLALVEEEGLAAPPTRPRSTAPGTE